MSVSKIIRVSIKIIGVFIAIIILVALLLQIDDKLNPELEALLAQNKPAEESEAYFYLLGIDAVEGEHPSVIGKQDFESDNLDTVERERLLLPDDELFCRIRDEGCLNTIFAPNNKVEPLLKTHQVLLDRYQTFIQMSDYRTLSSSLSFPQYEYLRFGHRLLILKAIHTADTTAVEQTILALRQQLERSDEVLGKLIYTGLLSGSIDVLSLLYRQNKQHNVDEIALLTPAELDFTAAFSRDSVMMHRTMVKVIEQLPQDSDKWVAKLTYKPNMTSNRQWERTNLLAELSQLSATEFVPAVVLLKKPEAVSLLSRIRNYTGNVLAYSAELAYSDFHTLIASVFDLNAKIALFNQTINMPILPNDITAIQNPYYDKDGTAYYSKSGNHICLDGPLEDGADARCLSLKL